MAIDLKLPELGENIETGDVVKVLVAVGEVVAKDQPILELETDKATFEVPAAAAGTVQTIHVKDGDRVAVGQVLVTVSAETSDAPASGSGESTRRVAPARVQDVASTGEPHVLEEAPAGESAPSVRPSGDKRVEVLDISRGARSAVAPAPRTPVPASPSVRRLARELGVDVISVTGSGPAGRISADDVKDHARAQLERLSAIPRDAGSVSQVLPDFSRWGAIERQSMRAVRRKTAEHVSRAWTTVPHVTQFDRADVTAVEGLRRRFAGTVERAGGKLTVTAIALKVAASALRVFPQFNASIDPENEEVILKHYIHIGVAVDTDRGLLVPVIRDVDRKNILQIAVELAEIAARATSKKTTLEEMEGGTFTISNLGGIGGTSFTPIVNWPQVAILGLSRASTEPVHADGSFEPRLMLPLALSYDHRLIDGADAIRFLRWIAQALEQPFLLALEG